MAARSENGKLDRCLKFDLKVFPNDVFQRTTPRGLCDRPTCDKWKKKKNQNRVAYNENNYARTLGTNASLKPSWRV